MFGSPVGSGLTFTKVLSGLSKTLNVANQVIPLYREAKPMIQNAKTILNVFKDMNGTSNTSSTSNEVKTVNTNISNNEKETYTRNIRPNNPSFFL